MTMKKTQIEQFERSLPGLIQARRKQQGMTLQELADKAGLSTAFLSQAERGKTTPSLGSILKLVGALEVDIDYFITPPDPNSLVRRADEPERIEVDSPLSYYRLDGAVKNKKLTVILVEVPPGCGVPLTRKDEGEEFGYILSGELHVEIGGEPFVLRAGDSVHFDAQVGRAAVNQTDSTCRALWVSTPPFLGN